ncbi:unnamed protein product [Caenorhabditis brenneri]
MTTTILAYEDVMILEQSTTKASTITIIDILLPNQNMTEMAAIMMMIDKQITQTQDIRQTTNMIVIDQDMMISKILATKSHNFIMIGMPHTHHGATEMIMKQGDLAEQHPPIMMIIGLIEHIVALQIQGFQAKISITGCPRNQTATSRTANKVKPRHHADYDEEQEFGKLMNKMKIGQRDREKLAEEMGFNDPPSHPRRRRGGRGYHH